MSERQALAPDLRGARGLVKLDWGDTALSPLEMFFELGNRNLHQALYNLGRI